MTTKRKTEGQHRKQIREAATDVVWPSSTGKPAEKRTTEVAPRTEAQVREPMRDSTKKPKRTEARTRKQIREAMSESDKQLRIEITAEIIRNHPHPNIPQVILNAMHLAAQSTETLEQARREVKAIADALPIPPRINISTGEVEKN